MKKGEASEQVTQVVKGGSSKREARDAGRATGEVMAVGGGGAPPPRPLMQLLGPSAKLRLFFLLARHDGDLHTGPVLTKQRKITKL